MANEEIKKAIPRFPELQEKAEACKDRQELLNLVREEGVELSDDELETLSGGSWNDIEAFISQCPVCGASSLEYIGGAEREHAQYRCKKCGAIST